MCSLRSSRTASTASSPSGSPPIGTVRTVRSPARLVSGSARPKKSSRARRSRRRLIPLCTAGEPASPSITICTGSAVSPGNSAFRAAYPCLAASRSGSVLTPASPDRRASTGAAIASRVAVTSTRLISGRRITARAVRAQNGLSARPAARPKNGIRRALTRSPSRLMSAGSSVRAAATETSATRIAAAARLRMTVLGTSTSRPWQA